MAESFVALAEGLVGDNDVTDTLDRLVSESVRLLEVTAAGILLSRGDDLEVAASSDGASELLEVFESQSRSGPCVEALRTGEPVIVTDTAQLQRRWPVLGKAAESMGFQSVYALPMRLQEQRLGALNLFHDEPRPLSPDDHRIGQALADFATIGILLQRSLNHSTRVAEQLQVALDSRTRLEQAKGLLAAWGGVDVDRAFAALRDYARSNRMKLSEVAGALVSRELEPGKLITAEDRD